MVGERRGWWHVKIQSSPVQPSSGAYRTFPQICGQRNKLLRQSSFGQATSAAPAASRPCESLRSLQCGEQGTFSRNPLLGYTVRQDTHSPNSRSTYIYTLIAFTCSMYCCSKSPNQHATTSASSSDEPHSSSPTCLADP